MLGSVATENMVPIDAAARRQGIENLISDYCNLLSQGYNASQKQHTYLAVSNSGIRFAERDSLNEELKCHSQYG